LRGAATGRNFTTEEARTAKIFIKKINAARVQNSTRAALTVDAGASV